MKQQSSNIDQIAQAIADLESMMREELICLQHEVIGARDGLSDELTERFDEINQRLDVLE